jgi:hypothetical protein
MSDFYELKISLPSNHSKRRAFFSADASRLMRERRKLDESDAIVTDSVAVEFLRTFHHYYGPPNKPYGK